MRSILAALFYLSCLGGVAPAQTLLHYISDPGDYIGKGQERTITPAEGYTFLTNESSPSAVSFYITGQTTDGLEFYNVGFAAPAGAILAPGNYLNATRYPFQTGTHPGLDIEANGAGSNTLTGYFSVSEITFDQSGKLTSFAADFVQHSEGEAPALYGQIRINSSVAVASPGVASFAGSTYTVQRSDGSVTLTVMRQGGEGGLLTVDYATADGSDLAGRDYTATSGTLIWEGVDTSARTVVIPILDLGDPLAPDGTFTVNLSGANVGTQNVATVTIVNNSPELTHLHFTSDVGDPIGIGREQTLSSDNGFAIQAGRNDDGGVSLTVDNYGQATDPHDYKQYTLQFAAPAGTDFSDGDYQGAGLFPSQSAGSPGLLFSSDGINFDSVVGNFQVREFEVDQNGEVLKFAADFEQHGDGADPGIYGDVRFKSAVPPPVRMPRISVSSSVGVVPEGGLGTFIISRSGDTAQTLKVRLVLGGSAVDGVDYIHLPQKATIPAGATATVLKVTPSAGASPIRRKVRVSVTPRAGEYSTVRNPKAKLEIISGH